MIDKRRRGRVLVVSKTKRSSNLKGSQRKMPVAKVASKIRRVFNQIGSEPIFFWMKTRSKTPPKVLARVMAMAKPKISKAKTVVKKKLKPKLRRTVATLI